MKSQMTSSSQDQENTSGRKVEAVHQAGLTVMRILDLQRVLESIVERATELFSPDEAILYHYDYEKGVFVPPSVIMGIQRSLQRGKMPDTNGIANRIAKEGKPVFSRKALRHAGLHQEFAEVEQLVSSAGIALRDGANTVGVLFLHFYSDHQFSSEERNKITLFASYAAIAIRNAELFRRQEAANKRLEILQQAQEAIDSTTRLQEVLDRILTVGLNIVNTGRGSLMLIQGEDLVTKAQFGPEISDPGREPMKFKVEEGIAGCVAKTGEAIRCSDIWEDPRFKLPPGKGKEDIRFRSLLSVPIISHQGKILGVINADNPEINLFDETHEQLLSDMARQFAAAIEKMMLVDTLGSLHKIFERITSTAIFNREIKSVLNEIADSAVNVLKIDLITIYIYDQGQEKFIVPPLIQGSISQDYRMNTEVYPGEAPWHVVHNMQTNHYAKDAPTDPVMNPPRAPEKGPGFVTREGIESSAGLRLKVGEDIVGVMFVNYRSPHDFSPREKQIIETFASSAAIAIQDVRQWETLKQTQEQLIQSAKMSAVGRLASGIAHELRNPLANILSSINLLELGRVSQQNMNAKYEIMKSEIHRARKIIDNLLNFVRPREAAQGPVDLLAIVNETISLLENQASLSKIKIDSQLARVPTIQGNATNLKQAFLNILINAIEAMPRGGILTVNMDVDGENIHIEIKDTGFGIPEDKKTQIFEPFYTTKAPGEGTGLGLALSYEIIHDHHGEIAVESEVEKGSIFIVTLPIGG